jgi:hypothetical protein
MPGHDHALRRDTAIQEAFQQVGQMEGEHVFGGGVQFGQPPPGG